MQHRLTRLRVEGMRTLEKIDLDLDGLRVLIGENGSGKSSIIEALEILRRTRSSSFSRDFNQIHGGINALRRHGAHLIRVGCTMAVVDRDGWTLDYDIAISDRGIESETASISLPRPTKLFERSGTEVTIYAAGEPVHQTPMPVGQVDTLRTAISTFRFANRTGLDDIQEALESIEVHVPFDVLPTWVANSQRRPMGVRGAVTAGSAERVEILGSNLANAYHALRNDDDEWDTTMGWVRLALGDWVSSVRVQFDAAGYAGLWVKCEGVDLELPARALSDGQLQMLGLVAVCRLKSNASIVAFDEPEAHLHPHLQDRAAQFFARLAERCPVLLATHSRRMLDELDEPAAAVRVCTAVGRPPATIIRELDQAALSEWMKEYDGFGKVLNAGYGEFVVRETPTPDEGK